ncbi:zinc knuckle CX2CX4HX4C containing protein [Tanacetum coccineum]
MYRRVQLEEPTIILDDSPMGEAFNSFKYCTDNVHESSGNGGMKPVSFASMFKDNTSKKTVYLSKLRNDKCVSGADVSIPLALVDKGMEQVLENGPWLIRLVPIILNTWTPNTRLKKDEITTILVWVKLHNVLIVAFSVGLSLITTKLGRPIMLDAYTSTTCLNSWGRNTYARALIEMSIVPETNVSGEASTSQPKETVHKNTQPGAKKVSSKSDDINIISFKNLFDALKDQDDMFENDKSA